MNREVLKGIKGITLIALVTTVMVLILLAGITISLVVREDSVIQKAKDAKQNMQYAQEESEEQLQYLQNDIAQSIENANMPPQVPEVETFSTIKEERETITTGGKTAIIPKGFAVGTSKGINNIQEGLVITDKVDQWGNSIGNEFVWIPVDQTQFARTNWSNNAPTGKIPGNYTEPSDVITTADQTGERAEYVAMTESVLANGGFYIARYEAGCKKERTQSNKETQQEVMIRKDKFVYNYVPWGANMASIENVSNVTGAVKLARGMYPKEDENSDVISHLIYGIQWDSVLRFVSDSTYNVTNSIGWGNYKDATESAGEDAGILQTTGKNEAWKAKNIYDLAGNAQEWSMEDADGFLRMLRGGAWDGSGTGNPASYRYGDFPDTCGSNYSFRPVLYLTILE